MRNYNKHLPAIFSLVLPACVALSPEERSSTSDSSGNESSSSSGADIGSSTAPEEDALNSEDVVAIQSNPTGSTTWRQTSWILYPPTYTDMWFGSNKGVVYCSEGSYAIGFRMRVEKKQGGGDDTALNAVSLLCKSTGDGTTEWIAAHLGNWGTWGAPAICPGDDNWLIGAHVKSEQLQGDGDDTSMNVVEFSCSKTGNLWTPGGGPWGDWRDWRTCPGGDRICGIGSYFMDWQQGQDDMGMTRMDLYCCW